MNEYLYSLRKAYLIRYQLIHLIMKMVNDSILERTSWTTKITTIFVEGVWEQQLKPEILAYKK
jgi:hypothetical protein